MSRSFSEHFQKINDPGTEKKVSACCSKVMNLFLISTHDDDGMCHVLAKSNITPWCY